MVKGITYHHQFSGPRSRNTTHDRPRRNGFHPKPSPGRLIPLPDQHGQWCLVMLPRPRRHPDKAIHSRPHTTPGVRAIPAPERATDPAKPRGESEHPSRSKGTRNRSPPGSIARLPHQPLRGTPTSARRWRRKCQLPHPDCGDRQEDDHLTSKRRPRHIPTPHTPNSPRNYHTNSGRGWKAPAAMPSHVPDPRTQVMSPGNLHDIIQHHLTSAFSLIHNAQKASQSKN
jgi:hypothetical protein